MATKNPKDDVTWYSAKGKQVLDSVNVPLTRKEVDSDLDRMSDKLANNAKTVKERPELKSIGEFADEGIQEQQRQLRKARQTSVGAGRGEVNPNAQGLKKGGMVGAASTRADGIAQRGKTKGRIV